MRRLRGTRLDPFGRAEVRRVERELIGEYEELVAEALALLAPDTHATALELLELPDVIRGYEEIKLRNVVLFRKRAEATLKRLRAGKPADLSSWDLDQQQLPALALVGEVGPSVGANCPRPAPSRSRACVPGC